jgi:23S rRNA pseudouridine2605 synthase
VGKWEELDQKAVDLLSRTVGLAKMAVPQQTPDEAAAQARQQRKAAPVTNRSNRAAGSPGSRAGQGARKWAVADSKPQRSGGKTRG